jgi:hypothetical protein
MGYDDGWAALHLDAPARVPHYEPSAECYHWDLIRAVTGLDVDVDSPQDQRDAASSAFVEAWNYDVFFGNAAWNDIFDAKSTFMGHAVYAKDGGDFAAVGACPFATPEEGLALDFYETYGSHDHAALVARFNGQYEWQCRMFPTAVNTSGVYVTLMSGLIAIFGWDMLLLMAGTDAEAFGKLCGRYAQWMQQYYDAVAECDADILYCHDDLVWTEGPFLHPGFYREHIFPHFKNYWAPAIESGKKVIYTGDGDYAQFAKDIANAGASGFWFECFTDLKYMTETFGKTHVLIGNGDCRPLTFGTKADVRAEVERCMSLGKNCPGYFMCISGHIPANVPVENALYYYDVYNELGRR